MASVMTVLTYGRVSTEEQSERGSSLSSQKEACAVKARELAKGNVSVIHFEDAMSGSHLARPGLDALRAHLRKYRPDYVVCLDPDRLARNLAHQLIITEEIKKYSQIAFVQHEYNASPEGQLFYQVRGAVAEYEKEKIKERTGRGRREKLRQGTIPYHVLIYGYDWDTTTHALIPNETEARWVRQMFAWASEGRRIPYIVDQLNAMGVPSKRGSKWYPSSVRTVVQNPSYVGRMRCNRYDWTGLTAAMQVPKAQRTEPITATLRPESEWITIAIPPIVEENVFALAQRLFNTGRRPSRRGQFLLSGLCVCALCGGAVNYITNEGNGYVLRCINRYPLHRDSKRPRTKCPLPHVRYTIIEGMVWEMVCSWLLNPDTILESLREGTADTTPMKVRLTERLDNLSSEAAGKQKMVVTTLEQQASGRIHASVADALLPKLSSEIAYLLAEIDKVTLELGRADAVTHDIDAFEATLRRSVLSMERLANLSAENRREIVRLIVGRVEVAPKRTVVVVPSIPQM